MAHYQAVFERKELKYLLTQLQWEALKEKMDPYMALDQYGQHVISNIYYDTPSWYLARHSLSKPTYKEKVRVRSYGVPSTNERVFIELKKKYKGIVYKRRTAMPLVEAEAFLNHKIMPETKNEEQILQEFCYVLDSYPDLQPAMAITYERLAYFGKDDPTVRITFDQDIVYRTEDLSLAKGAYGQEILPEGKLLMEIKIAGGMPLWLARALGELAIYPASFSKFSTAYLNELKESVKKG